MAKKKGPAAFDCLLDLPVQFGNVNCGDKTARIGITLDRGGDQLTIAQADKQLVERRLTVRMVARPPGDNHDQDRLPGMDDDEKLDAVVDVKGFSVSKDTISFGLTFAIASVDVGALAHFAKRAGKLVVTCAEDIPERNGDDSDSELES